MSQWGQDFRPRTSPSASSSLSCRPPSVAALTATTPIWCAATSSAFWAATRPARSRASTGPACVSRWAARAQASWHVPGCLHRRRAESGIVYCAKRATVEVCDHLREARHRGHPLPRRAHRRGARRNQAGLRERYGPGHSGHQRLRHGHRQVQRQLRGALGHARVGGGLLPGGRPRRARRSPAECPCAHGATATSPRAVSSSSKESTHEGLTAEAEVVPREPPPHAGVHGRLLLHHRLPARVHSPLLREGGHDEALPSQGGATEVAPTVRAGAGGETCLTVLPAPQTPAIAMPPATPPSVGGWILVRPLPDRGKFLQARRRSGAARTATGNSRPWTSPPRLAPSCAACRLCAAASARRRWWTCCAAPTPGICASGAWWNLPVYGTLRDSARPAHKLVELLAADGYLAITEGIPAVGFGPRYRGGRWARFCAAHQADAEGAQRARPNRRRLPVLAPPISPRRTSGSLRRLRALRHLLARRAAVPPLRHLPTTPPWPAMAAARPSQKEKGAAGPPPASARKKLATYGKAFLEDHGCAIWNQQRRVRAGGGVARAQVTQRTGTTHWAVPPGKPIARLRSSPAQLLDRYNLFLGELRGRCSHFAGSMAPTGYSR